GFCTVVGNVSLTKGRWFYQVVLGTAGLRQIGWCTSQHRPDAKTGVGDDSFSYAYDGHRLKKWHLGSINYSLTKWKVGDVVGCLLDLDVDGGEMRFSL